MDDLISRQAAIKTAHFPVIDDAGYEVVRVDDILALPSATCEDCIWHVCNYNKIDWEGEDGYISRHDAIRWVKTECNPYGKPTLDFESGKRVIEHLEQMQSADRPSGEWISNHDGSWNCSECGLRVVIYAKRNYCPNFGAKMEGRK